MGLPARVAATYAFMFVLFVFVFGPELLWKGPLWKTTLTFVTAAAALVFLAAAIERYSRWSEVWWTRLLLAAGAFFLIVPKLWTAAVGAGLVALAIGATRMRGGFGLQREEG
ncbi:MAG TPA: hypothetical protein VGB25_04635 [Candidatus Binatia bacterium]